MLTTRASPVLAALRSARVGPGSVSSAMRPSLVPGATPGPHEERHVERHAERLVYGVPFDQGPSAHIWKRSINGQRIRAQRRALKGRARSRRPGRLSGVGRTLPLRAKNRPLVEAATLPLRAKKRLVRSRHRALCSRRSKVSIEHRQRFVHWSGDPYFVSSRRSAGTPNYSSRPLGGCAHLLLGGGTASPSRRP